MALADAAHGARALARAHAGMEAEEQPRREDAGLLRGERTIGRIASLLHTTVAERWLRRAVPAFVLLLLAGILGLHALLMLNERNAAQREAAHALETAGRLVALRLALHPALKTALEDADTARAILEEALAVLPRSQRARSFLLDERGRVVVSRPSDPALTGVGLSRLLGGNSTLIAGGASAGALPVQLDGIEPATAVLHTIADRDGAAQGGIVLARTDAQVNAPWQDRTIFQVALFLAVGTVLLVFVYAYMAQTARLRETEGSFAETAARFDAALARGHSGLWDWDVARGTMVWSESMYRILGLEPQDRPIGFGEVRDRLHPDEADLVLLADSILRADQTQVDHRFHMRHADGHYVCLRLRGELVTYRRTTPHLIGIAVDISELEAQRQRQRDADIRLRDAIETISEAFVLWDSRRRLVMCNSKYQQLYRLPSSVVKVGATFDDVMAAAQAPAVDSEARRAAREANGSVSFEAQLQDGRWLQISERKTQDGGFVSIGTDITTIKTHETRLRTSEHELIEKNDNLRDSHRQLELQAQKLVELAEGLREEKERAKAGSRAKSEFLANISHELRTPLNAILGFSDVMQQRFFGPLGAEQYEEYARDIHESGTFLLNVINDILDMSKIEAGRMELSPERVSVQELLSQTLRFIQGQAQTAQLKVESSIPDGMVIEADRRAVKQILLNLLSNAVKFTPEGGRVEVTAKTLDRSVVIMIHDNGIGISAAALSRLGRPFEQVQSQFTKNHHGSGLGLAIARSLVQMHGGSLKIRSREGKGTLVAVRLPFQAAELADQSAGVVEALQLPEAAE